MKGGRRDTKDSSRGLRDRGSGNESKTGSSLGFTLPVTGLIAPSISRTFVKEYLL